jgi:tRNA (guanine-N7-)-methyltransferase
MGAYRPRGRAASRLQLSAGPAAANPADRPLLYGRRHGPRLRAEARRLLDEVLPRVEFSLEPGAPVDPRRLFPTPPQEIWLEVGFGGGEHLAAQAERHRDVGFLGVEPFVNGVAKLLRAVEREHLSNVRVLMDDARLLLRALGDGSVDRAFILFPDPWPKLRHHKRRLVNRNSLAELARVVRPGGLVRLATDHADYARWMLAAALAEPDLAWTAERARDWREPPTDWVATRYEAKARAAGRRPVFLELARRALRRSAADDSA